MKAPAIVLVMAAVGSSNLICRDLKFKTGLKSSCPWGYSGTSFKLMPFDMPIPLKCRLVSGSECTMKVCGTKAEFSKPLVVKTDEKKVNSWNFNIYADKSNVPLKPATACQSGKPTAFCCGMQTRMDMNTKSAVFSWPSLATPSPTGSPTSASVSASPSMAPTRQPVATSNPTAVPSFSPTAPRSCDQLNSGECKASEVCRATNGKRGKKPCEDAKCKKFKRDTAMCEKAPHCKLVNNKRKSKCVRA